MELYKPQEGTWTLTAPDGRQWQAESGLLAAAKEQRERIPPTVMLERIKAGLAPNEDEIDAERYRWLRENISADMEWYLFGKHGQGATGMDEAIDAAILSRPTRVIR